MHTATFSPRRFDLLISGRELPAGAPETGWFAQPNRLVLDAGDIGAVAFTFAFVAGLVLSGALACDAFLVSVIIRGVGSMGDVAAYQLASDLLPWACTFTIITAGLAFFGMKTAKLLRRRSNGYAGLGFVRG